MTTLPLLLLHGALGAAEQFAPLRPFFPAAHAFDLEGHGRQAVPARPFRIHHFAEQTLAYMDEQELAVANIFGHSMGGYIGLYLALHHPERVGKVFTLGTKLGWTAEFATAELRQMDAERMVAKVPQFAEMLASRHTDWRTTLAKMAELTSFLGNEPPLTLENLAQVSRPVRLGLGDRDKMVTLEETTAAFHALPHGELHVLPATPHPLERAPWPRLAQAIADCFGTGA